MVNECKFCVEFDVMIVILFGFYCYFLIGSVKFFSRGGGDALFKVKRARVRDEFNVFVVVMFNGDKFLKF